MAVSAIRCGKCGTQLPPEYFNLDHLTGCPGCQTPTQALVFPALFSTPPHAAPGAAASEHDATCFYHSENVALTTCAACGRFLCSVCEMDLGGGEVLCPGCAHAGVTTRKLARLENRRTLYDSIALALAGLPMLLVWPTVITAPMALFVSIRYWKAPLSLVRPTRARFVIAILLALAQIASWGFLAYLLYLYGGNIQ